MSSLSRIAVIPAYEPDEALPTLAADFAAAGFSVVVVDDGSSAACAPIFEAAAAHATVLVHPQNRGKGCALKTAFAHLADTLDAPAIIVTVDADGQHRLSDAKQVCEMAERRPEALVLGCRRFTGKVPLRSRFGNSVTRLVYRLSAGCRVSDTQTGLRAFHSDRLPFLLGIDGERYEYEMNMLLACPRAGIPFAEVPIETIYLNDNQSSHFDPLRDSLRIYREVARFAGFALSSFISFLADYGLFALFSLLTRSLSPLVAVPLCNVAARVFSATLNFTLNKKVVFRTRGHVARSAAQYVLLAAGVLVGNTLVLSLLVNLLHLPSPLAKLITEALFFLVSWLAQRHWVFKKSS